MGQGQQAGRAIRLQRLKEKPMQAMHMSEAIEAMERLFPGKYVTARLEAVRYGRDGGGNREIEYALYVEGRGHYKGQSFLACLAQIPEAQPPATLAQADADTADAVAIA